MVISNLSRRRTPLERHHDEVINHLLDGTPSPEIAKLYGVSKTAVFIFKARHEEELNEMRLKVAEQSKELAIAEKVNRIAEYGHLYGLMRSDVDENGLFVTEVRHEKDSDVTIETRDFRANLVKEMRGTLRSVAEETGQLPRPEVNIDARTLATFTIKFDSPAIAEHNVTNEIEVTKEIENGST